MSFTKLTRRAIVTLKPVCEILILAGKLVFVGLVLGLVWVLLSPLVLPATADYADWPGRVSAITAVLLFGATCVGIYYLRQTLQATADAVTATNEANKIMREGQRAWLKICSATVAGEIIRGHGASFSFIVKNVGKAPAHSIRIFIADEIVIERTRENVLTQHNRSRFPFNVSDHSYVTLIFNQTIFPGCSDTLQPQMIDHDAFLNKFRDKSQECLHAVITYKTQGVEGGLACQYFFSVGGLSESGNLTGCNLSLPLNTVAK